MSRKIKKIRGEHGLNFFISYQLKKKLQTLAQKYDTSLADIVRTLLKIGIPVLEGYREAQEQAEKEIDTIRQEKISGSGDPELPRH
ncbi:MAG: hypothetical protein ACRENF_05795 [Thermodesulfobacteriota bacterium]